MTMDMNARDAAAAAENSRLCSNHDQRAAKARGVKTVLMLTLFASICGWLWLLGKGAVAIAGLLRSL